MKSTVKIHEIVEAMPVDDRREMMRDLKELRILVAEEIVSAMRNSNKMINLMYSK